MSMFICARCGGFADSDDGCESYDAGGGHKTSGLICIDCLTEEDDEPVNEYGEEGSHAA